MGAAIIAGKRTKIFRHMINYSKLTGHGMVIINDFRDISYRDALQFHQIEVVLKCGLHTIIIKHIKTYL